jgi:hypothetical protein
VLSLKTATFRRKDRQVEKEEEVVLRFDVELRNVERQNAKRQNVVKPNAKRQHEKIMENFDLI